MSVIERKYMSGSDNADSAAGMGVVARDREHAEAILRFACPTKGADGLWYRCTIAVSNVPVRQLYNILSSAGLIAHRLREVARAIDVDAAVVIESEARNIDAMRDFIRQADRPGGEVAGSAREDKP